MTVGELIQNLSILDPKLDVVILDADTQWLLNIDTIVDEGDYVSLESNYSDRWKKK